MYILNAFAGLGLSREHALLYKASLEWGETSITNLAESSGVPRTTAYPFVNELVDLGLLKVSLKRGKKNYIPADPEFLQGLLQKKQEELNKLNLDLLENMSDIKLQMKKGNKPKLSYLEGADGIKQAYEMTFEAEKTGDEVLIQCLTEDYEEVVGGDFFDKYFNTFFSKNLRSRELLASGDEDYMAKYGSEKNLQRVVKTDDKPTETDIMIFGNKVIFVSFNKQSPYALVIEDTEIVYSMKSLYEAAWKQAE